jgi:hypothetical protein
MSKISNIVSRKHNHVIKKYYGDTVIFRPQGGTGTAMTGVLDVRDIQSFAGSGYDSTEGPVSTVDSQQLWFLLFKEEFEGRPGPRIGDNIMFEQRAYEIVQVMDEVYGKVWTRVHEAELGIGAFREF